MRSDGLYIACAMNRFKRHVVQIVMFAEKNVIIDVHSEIQKLSRYLAVWSCQDDTIP
jgi:CO dehydrogenase nickel-insertion accessory protein CooC1